MIDALLQTFAVVRPERGSMWGAMVLGLLGGTGALDDEAAIVKDVEWNLRTWPLEMICWPVDNTPRDDVIYDHAISRFGRVHTQVRRGSKKEGERGGEARGSGGG